MRKCRGVKLNVLHDYEGLPAEKKRADRVMIGKMVTDEKEIIGKTTMVGIDHGDMKGTILAVVATGMLINTTAVVNAMKVPGKMINTTITTEPEASKVATAKKNRGIGQGHEAERDDLDPVARNIIQKTDTTRDHITTKRNDFCH